MMVHREQDGRAGFLDLLFNFVNAEHH